MVTYPRITSAVRSWAWAWAPMDGALVGGLGLHHGQLLLHLNDAVLRRDEVGLHLGPVGLSGGQHRLGLAHPRGELDVVEARDHLAGAGRIARIEGGLPDPPRPPRGEIL